MNSRTGRLSELTGYRDKEKKKFTERKCSFANEVGVGRSSKHGAPCARVWGLADAKSSQGHNDF